MKTAPKWLAAAFLAGAFAASAGFAAYQQASPHLNAALESLKTGKMHLTESKATGMHTKAAMQATDQAIMHTEEAIKAGEEGAMK